MSDDTAITRTPDAAGHSKLQRWFDNRFRTPVAIYGLIVYTTVVLIADEEGPVSEMLAIAISSLVVFYLAHVFAHTLSDHGRHGLGAATRLAFIHSLGMIYACAPSTIAMIITAFFTTDAGDVQDAAIWTALAMLAVLGFSAYARTGAKLWVRLLGALGTALLGLLVVLLEFLLH
ncbi:hypothetical protein SK224_06015 [Microbacterium sp. BG28]|uniref:hypothetical protein n=1 Tax=Microbacterium sp. BG28 TaxID=3097356 RepID=UPI002A5AB136|nr:hypothetical protein [Microbacterium sp. BG28]MDY0828681.1 hypothetical protein [Microbacterium sp. BG28]